MTERRPKAVADPSDVGEARRVAVKALKTRLVSSGALVSRLVRRGFEREAAEAAAADLERMGLLNDRKLAESVVRRQMGAKAVGKRVMLAKLRQKGIVEEVAKAAAEAEMAGRDALADAVDLARRRVKGMKPGMDREVAQRRVFGYLARRGFDAEVCRKAAEAVL